MTVRAMKALCQAGCPALTRSYRANKIHVERTFERHAQPTQMINFQTSPEQYKHWKLSIDGAIARLSMDVQEDATLADGYKLKLNSYDLGVDIELADAIQRVRFEHPEKH